MEKRKLSSHYSRKILGNLTQAEFSEMFSIPIGTIQNWDSRGTMPIYIERMCSEIAAREHTLDLYMKSGARI